MNEEINAYWYNNHVNHNVEDTEGIAVEEKETVDPKQSTDCGKNRSPPKREPRSSYEEDADQEIGDTERSSCDDAPLSWVDGELNHMSDSGDDE
ncbi:MAG: hypothetical protein MJA27_12140 [Pseudanabaenales cyanobacterium]|nr:hypothetical protein [Pseudanabaenales cyanobacterium]